MDKETNLEIMRTLVTTFPSGRAYIKQKLRDLNRTIAYLQTENKIGIRQDIIIRKVDNMYIYRKFLKEILE